MRPVFPPERAGALVSETMLPVLSLVMEVRRMDTRALGAAGSAQGVGQSRFHVVPGADAVPTFPDQEKPIRVVTLRITPAQHQRIRAAAHLGKSSMNQMLVAAAMQAVEAAEQQDARRIHAAAAEQTTGATVGAA